MPVPIPTPTPNPHRAPSTAASSSSSSAAAGANIWIAAGEGDLERVKYLVEEQGISPSAPDQFTYTPLHAAASYAHAHVLRYLLTTPYASQNAVNTTDSDGETPLFACETVEIARLLVEQFGADPKWKNGEGNTPAENADENEWEEVASYLRSVTGELAPSSGLSSDAPLLSASSDADLDTSADDDADATTKAQTDELLTRVEEIMRRCEAENKDPEEELRTVVGEAVLRQILEGYEKAVPGRAGAEAAGEAERGDGAQGPER